MLGYLAGEVHEAADHREAHDAVADDAEVRVVRRRERAHEGLLRDLRAAPGSLTA